ncbi:hypothetical protein ACUN24_13675 [Pedobacter sp. WC2501]|uniref:hypothetical protein n=1 Tax=Pedobacter sp. WC2501 TaxID=3461400 RepID=UPI0040465566
MKKITLVLILMITIKLGFAQDNNTFPTQGNVGMGTLNPQAKLDIKGNIQFSSAEIPFGLNTEVGGTTPLFNMSVNFREANKNNAYVGAAFRIDTRISELPLFQWLKRDAGTDLESVIMNLNKNGNLGIGVPNAAERLSVNGNIRAKEVKVEATNWPDYVFEKKYILPTLKETMSYIEQYGHLPDMPSADVVAKEGQNLGEIQAKLLKKVEELTLHLIRLEESDIKQKKRIDEQDKIINNLKKKSVKK